ncbi:MAG TPA: hypothetical protein VF282_10295, partial [Bacillota bacterium]
MSELSPGLVTEIVQELLTEAFAGKTRQYTWFIDKEGLLETLAGPPDEQASASLTPGGSTIAGHAEHLRWHLSMANAFAR